MSIYVIRHADKEQGYFHTEGLRFNDQPLSTIGIGKAQRLATYFEQIPIDGIYVSEYRRTGQTIAPVAKMKHMQPIVDPRLNEIDVGVTELMTVEDIKRQYPEFWKALVDRDHDFRIPGGETGAEASRRIMNLVSSLDRSRNQILVTHEGLIRILLCTLFSMPPFKRHLFGIEPCSITLFTYLEEFSCWSVPKINMELPL